MLNIPLFTQTITPIIIEEKQPAPTEKLYTIKENDNLTLIAKNYNTTVEKLWEKNTDLKDPNLLEPNNQLKIPLDNEELPDRPLPAPKPLTAPVQTPQSGAHAGTPPSPARGAVSGNTGRFAWGWCTYFASQQRPDLDVTGNAGEWIRYANSKTPQIGAVAVNTWAAGYGHVAIVIAIKPNEILVRHMNWRGFGVVSEDWVSTDYWSGYIL